MNDSYRAVSVVLSVLSILAASSMLNAQQEQPIYDESEVPEYTLPDPLVAEDGSAIETPQQWEEKQRPRILELFEREVYGKAPPAPEKIEFEVTESADDALAGTAIRKQVSVRLTPDEDGPVMDILIYLPKNAEKPAPVFLGLNFYGNMSIHPDPAIHLSKSWMRNNKEKGTENHQATDATRGTSKSRWPVEMILEHGYGLATIYYGDIDPDFDDGFQNGVHPHFMEEGQTQPKPDQWGSIAAWAWGLSRALDYLQQDEDVDGEKVIVMGHSRLGKTSLWAGATDPRFAAVISNNSGCGGAALSRRRFGESVKRINTSFPHWFCDNFNKYNHNEDACPVDQHMLIALQAPRPALVCSAEEDRWADPRGEFLSTLHADPVYRLFGVEGLETEEMPPVDQPVLSRLGYSIRTGKHDVLQSDWQRYIKFADQHVLGK